ncbi:MAG: hypothetical protein UR60_C0018G0003 [Candidatus Moranbacteria bacterium GW2011_GWF2_34_56]|nr:MAG: hypothetical protein UR60_C0018G0003 [Candidatus Moranbacteria bacterium GW2011_GWF2_34_56]HBI17113.1 hypothetical protein [Candidatus Moranbacteria bacterium]
MGKKLIIGLVLIILGGIFAASLVNGKDLDREQKYYDSTRDAEIGVTFYKKVAYMTGENFGPKIKLSLDSKDVYKNEKNNLTLLEKDDEVIIFIGKKKVFEGNLQKDNSYKNRLASTLTEKVWLWENLIIGDDNLLKPFDPKNFNLSFSKDGKILATTNCANFEGTYVLNKNSLIISSLTQTKNICSNKEGERFIQILGEVNSVALDNENNLVLFLKNNSGSMSFEKK